MTMCLLYVCSLVLIFLLFFFQAEDGIRDLVRSRGLGDVYKRQLPHILEHVVLAGSAKYPLKDPFFEMVKGSLATYILSLIHI